MIELRYNTQQILRVGVLLAKTTKFEKPIAPICNALLSWYYWRYLIKADGTVVDIVNRSWLDIPQCAGCYFLTVTAIDTNKLGPLILYIYDVYLAKPIYLEFAVISQNVYDSKYGNQFLLVDKAEKF